VTTPAHPVASGRSLGADAMSDAKPRRSVFSTVLRILWGIALGIVVWVAVWGTIALFWQTFIDPDGVLD
jgi:hypothetical protein